MSCVLIVSSPHSTITAESHPNLCSHSHYSHTCFPFSALIFSTTYASLFLWFSVSVSWFPSASPLSPCLKVLFWLLLKTFKALSDYLILFCCLFAQFLFPSLTQLAHPAFDPPAFVLDYCLGLFLETVGPLLVLTPACPLDFASVSPSYLVARLPIILCFVLFSFNLLDNKSYSLLICSWVPIVSAPP